MRYKDPWADVGNAALDAFYKYQTTKPSQADIVASNADLNLKKSQADKYAAETALLRSQAQAPDSIAAMFGDIYNTPMESPAPTPDFVGPGAPVAPTKDVLQERFTQNLPDMFANAMRYSGDKPGNLADVYLAMAAAGGGSPDQITNAQMGAQMDYADTQPGFEQDQGYTLSPGSVRYGADNQQVASAPFKPGGSGPSFRMNSDGSVEYSEGGLPQQGLTKATANQLQKEQVANAKLRRLLDITKNLAKEDPSNFGFPGFVKGVGQDANALLGGISQTFGYQDTNSAVADAQREIAGSGVDPSLLSGVFDPNLPALQTAADLLVFQAASSLAGQSGRSVSDRDVKMFKGIVGDPQSIFGNQQKFLAKLAMIENILGMNENVTDTAMGGNVTGAASGQPQGWSDAEEQRLQELEAMMGGQ